MRLQGKVAIVTGGGSGIGRGICIRFAEEGADIVVADIDEEGAEQTAALVGELGRQAVTVVADVSKRDEVKRLLSDALARFGTFDILCNNAGILRWGSIIDASEEDWDRVMDVNLKGVFLCTQEAARYWVEQGKPGKIVNTDSASAEFALPEQSAYCASKGGVKMFTKAAALDLAQHKINVNAIGPGGTETNISANSNRPGWRPQGAGGAVPLGRGGTPRDMANVALFLASDDADYITGELLMVTGGRTSVF